MAIIASDVRRPGMSTVKEEAPLLKYDFMCKLFVEPDNTSILATQRGVLFVKRFTKNLDALVDTENERVEFGAAGYQRLKIFLATIGYQPKAYTKISGMEGVFCGNDYADAKSICIRYKELVVADGHAQTRSEGDAIELDKYLLPYFIAIAMAAERPDVAILWLRQNAQRLNLDLSRYFENTIGKIFSLCASDAQIKTITTGEGSGMDRFTAVLHNETNGDLFSYTRSDWN